MTEEAANLATSGCHVFVSYASPDLSVANAIVGALENNGVMCWVAPRDVRPGAAYAEAIVRAINGAGAFILVLSGSAMASEHVSREVERAGSKHKHVIAFKIDSAALSSELEYFLSRSQWIDVAALGMPSALARLIEAVQGSRSHANATAAGGAPGGSVANHAAGTMKTADGSVHGHGLPIKLPFLEQIKRRNVGRVATLYVGVCYLILEFFSTFLHVLALPEWTGRTLAALMVAGFPVVLLLSWVFELTPQGIKPAAQDEVSPSSRKLTGRRLDFAIIVVLVLALGYFAADKFWLSKRVAGQSAGAPEAALSSASIAVLPFADLSEKHDQEYFADGLSEELVDVLGRIPDLRVIGHSSSFQFKGKPADLRSVGTQLGAAHIVTGSVRRSGNHVRVTAQLIRAADGAHEWSGTYDRGVEDVLQVQTELATSLGRALELSVSDLQEQPAAKPPKLEVYDLYLRGLHANDRYTRDGLEEASSYLERAIDLDASFVPAYRQLGLTHLLQAAYQFVPVASGFVRVQDDAARLLKLDPKSGWGDTLLCRFHTYYSWNWPEAERQCKSALALAPRFWGAQFGAADLALIEGKYENSARVFRGILAIDPLSADTYAEMSLPLLRLGRLAEAESAGRRALAITPTYAGGHSLLGITLMAEDRFEDARQEFQLEGQGGDQSGLAMVLHALGRTVDSTEMLEHFIRESGEDSPFYVAQAYAYLGEADHAFEWLERAYRHKDPALIYVKGDWPLRGIEEDPRYQAFLRKMNLPE